MQKVQLEIYKDFEEVCVACGVSSFVLGGAAIGILRHQGFIPWDDDIDVCMLREDYNRLVKYMQEHPSQKYTMITAETQEGCVLSFGKFSKNGTEFIEEAHSYRSYIPGIAIDVFPYDATSTDVKERKRQIKRTWLWNRMMVLAEYNTPTLPENMGKISRQILSKMCWLAHYGLKILGITREKAYCKYIKYARMYEQREDVYYTDFSYPNPEKLLLKKQEIFPLTEYPFEETTVKTIKEIKRYLTSQYGDFMQLPPEEQRHNHPPKYVDFGDGIIVGEK